MLFAIAERGRQLLYRGSEFCSHTCAEVVDLLLICLIMSLKELEISVFLCSVKRLNDTSPLHMPQA